MQPDGTAAPGDTLVGPANPLSSALSNIQKTLMPTSTAFPKAQLTGSQVNYATSNPSAMGGGQAFNPLSAISGMGLAGQLGQANGIMSMMNGGMGGAMLGSLLSGNMQMDSMLKNMAAGAVAGAITQALGPLLGTAANQAGLGMVGNSMLTSNIGGFSSSLNPVAALSGLSALNGGNIGASALMTGLIAGGIQGATASGGANLGNVIAAGVGAAVGQAIAGGISGGKETQAASIGGSGSYGGTSQGSTLATTSTNDLLASLGATNLSATAKINTDSDNYKNGFSDGQMTGTPNAAYAITNNTYDKNYLCGYQRGLGITANPPACVEGQTASVN